MPPVGSDLRVRPLWAAHLGAPPQEKYLIGFGLMKNAANKGGKFRIQLA